MDPSRLALPGNLARSLRHLDDAPLEELLRTARAEARRRGLTEERRDRATSQSATGNVRCLPSAFRPGRARLKAPGPSTLHRSPGLAVKPSMH